MIAKSVEELVKQYAQPVITVGAGVKLEIYLRSLQQVETQANQYEHEGAVEKAYLFAMRYALTALEMLPKHPAYRSPEYKQRLSDVKKVAVTMLGRCEALKPSLDALYIQQQQLQQYKQQQQQQQPTAPPLPPPEPQPVAPPLPSPVDYSSLASLSAAVGVVTPLGQQGLPPLPPPPEAGGPLSALYGSVDIYGQPHHQYPQQPINNEQGCVSHQHHQTAAIDGVAGTGALASYTDNNEQLMSMRTIVIDPSIIPLFIQVAEQTSRRGNETCGVLSGVLKDDMFTITHLVIPKQEGGPDSCSMLDELGLFDFHDKHGLLTLGWIHTHPTQSIFLSSVDLHTTLPYQQLMSEAIAIVVNPNHTPNHSVFILTQQGVSALSSCNQRGFHPHPEKALYTTPKHIKFHPGTGIQLADLRFK